MDIKIDKGVPLPSAAGGGSKAIYPFRELQIGDSFFLPNVTHSNICGSISGHTRRHGGKFSVRKVTEAGVTGIRVWRVA